MTETEARWVNPSIADFCAFECSSCGSFVHVPTCNGEPLYQYCPHCGAKIKEAST